MPTIKVVCRIINHDFLNEDIYAEPIETKGSVENLIKLCSGELDLAIVNSVAIDYARKGEGPFKKISNLQNLRSVAGMIFDSFIIIVNEKAGINSVKDFKGKNISIPVMGAAARIITDEILAYNNISDKDFNKFEYNIGDCIEKMEIGKIDGFMILTAQPNPYLYGITNSKNVKCKFVSLQKDTISFLLSKFPGLVSHRVRKDLYPYSNSMSNINTVGSRGILVTTKNKSKKIIYNITGDLCDDFQAFKEVNKSFSEVTPLIMATKAFIPLHPGAYKYYRKIKLSKDIPQNLRPK